MHVTILQLLPIFFVCSQNATWKKSSFIMSDIHNIICQYSNYKQHILPTIKTNKYHNKYHIGSFLQLYSFLKLEYYSLCEIIEFGWFFAFEKLQ